MAMSNAWRVRWRIVSNQFYKKFDDVEFDNLMLANMWNIQLKQLACLCEAYDLGAYPELAQAILTALRDMRNHPNKLHYEWWTEFANDDVFNLWDDLKREAKG